MAEFAVSRKKDTVDGYEGPVLGVGAAPFGVNDRARLADVVTPVVVDEVRFAALIEEMNAACRAWSLQRRLEVEPTLNQQSDWYGKLARKAANLADLLQDIETVDDFAAVSEPGQHLPSLLPHDEDHVLKMQARGGGLEHLPDDPTAEADGSLPWHLERLRNAFSAHYFGVPPEPRAIQLGNEALLEIVPLLRALAGAAKDEAASLQRHQSEEKTASTGAPSANEQLVRRLAPIYEALFDRKLRRSMKPVLDDNGEPTEQHVASGPAIRFFRLIFGRLCPVEEPSDNSLGTYISKVQRESNRRQM
ncbi:MAG: hypothetical protein AAGH68_12610 [Pseudomonadota bacterium]